MQMKEETIFFYFVLKISIIPEQNFVFEGLHLEFQ